MAKLEIELPPALYAALNSGEAVFIGTMVLYPNEDQLRFQFSSVFPLEEAMALVHRYGLRTEMTP